MTKYTQIIELRRPTTLATVALCLLLPGCPLTDDYFLDRPGQGSSAGSAQMLMSGAGEVSAAGTSATAGNPATDKDAGCECASGGSGSAAGNSNHDPGKTDDAGSGDAGSADAGATSAGTGGTGAYGGNAEVAGTAGIAGTASGGVAGSAGAPQAILPEPACAEGVGKGSTCTPNTPVCYKNCGPDNAGYKAETCQGGVYDELQQGCTFPVAQDYSCYKLPTGLPAACPAGVPRGGRPCQIASCTVCFGGNSAAPQYQDSTGAQKPGYCVCSEAGSWTCGSVTSWPCPGGQGCN